MTRLERFGEALRAAGAECAVISSEINQRYLSGFPFSDGYILVTPDEDFLLTDSRYIEAAKKHVNDLSVILASGGMLASLKRLISDKGISEVAIEEADLSCADLKKFTEEFSGVEIKFGASEILKGLRAVKSADEIAKISEAQRLTDEAFSHILDFLSPERTESEVALELEFFMRRRGAEGVAFDTIAVSGEASSLPHGVPSDVPLRRGFLTMDFGAKVDGYCSDMTRTVVIGRADEEMKRIYSTVLTAQQTALSFIRGGIPCRDADEAARSVIREAGFGANFGHSLGHGVGMFIHEFPNLSPKADPSSVLRAGNVVTVEPGIYIEGKYGCRIEDMIAIREDGSVHNFTQSQKNLIEIV
ncbi:MAG: aminopeptidase P family protein [Clostridia bacterium]|nr:aminopeptidase P family protein [Clostridia bacterium]